MTTVRRIALADEAATLAAGASIALEMNLHDELVFLEGDLGAGKTTLVRGMLRAWGHAGAVKSPTYTLLEPYELGTRRIYHFDFYRIDDPTELTYIGIDDLLTDDALKLIEWPANGAALLPPPEIVLSLSAGGAEAGITSSELPGRWLEIEDRRATDV